MHTQEACIVETRYHKQLFGTYFKDGASKYRGIFAKVITMGE